MVELPGCSDAVADPPRPSPLERRLLISVVALGLVVDYMLLTIVVPIFPHIKEQYDISVFSIGCLFAIKPALQALVDPLLAPLVDRGWVWPFVAGLVLEAGTTLLFAFSESYATTMISRALQGVASACIMTTGMALVARVHAYDDKARGIAMSLTVTGVAVGVSFGPPVGGILFEIGGMKLPFLVVTGLTVMILCAAVPAIHCHVRWQAARDAAAARNVGALENDLASESKEAPASPNSTFRRILTDPYMVLVYGALTFGNSALGMLEPTIGLYMEHELHYSAGTIGLSFLGATLSTLACGPIAGCLGNRFGRGPLIFCGVIMLGGGYCSLTADNGSLWSIILALVIMGIGIGCVDGCSPALLGQIADLRHSDEVYGTVFALRGVAESLGFIAGPLIATALMGEMEFRATTILLGSCVAAYAPLLLALKCMPEFKLARADGKVDPAQQDAPPCSPDKPAVSASGVTAPEIAPAVSMAAAGELEAEPCPVAISEKVHHVVVSI